MGVWPLSLGEGHGPPTLVELFSGRGTASVCEAYEDLGRTSWLEQKRAREQPKLLTGEETVRGPREERLGSTAHFWRAKKFRCFSVSHE